MDLEKGKTIKNKELDKRNKDNNGGDEVERGGLKHENRRLKAELAEAQKKIIELEIRNKELKEKLTIDELTGLARRGVFLDFVNKHIGEIKQEKQHHRREGDNKKNLTITIAFFDIDNFKKINDTHGHDFGDIILKEVANILKNNTRASDIVSRWGGEEMIIAFLGANEEEVTRKLEKIRKKIEDISTKYTKDYPNLKVTVSVGVKEYEGEEKAENLIKTADEMMYLAKKTGKNKVVSYSRKEESNERKKH